MPGTLLAGPARRGAPMVVLATLALASGCGRLMFHDQPVADGGADVLDATPPGPDSGPACDPTAPFGAPVLIPELSDPVAFDGTLRLAPDELSGYFWSRRGGMPSTIYLVTRPDWQTPFTLTIAQGVNGLDDNLDPTLSADGTLLVFRRSGAVDDLYMATRTAPDTFVNVVPVATLNSTTTEAQPFLQPGGNELVFQAMRTGSGDLYRSTLTGTSFSAPVRITELATPDQEGDPVLSADGLTLLFRAKRDDVTNFDIFVTTRTSPAALFGTPELLPGVNSADEDGPSSLSVDGCRLYLSSDRAGSLDVYVATRGS